MCHKQKWHNLKITYIKNILYVKSNLLQQETWQLFFFMVLHAAESPASHLKKEKTAEVSNFIKTNCIL